MKNLPSLDYRIPIVIGVCGHRDIPAAAIDPLCEVLREIFRQLQSNYPQSPFALISCLAEGADQIAAEVALEFNFSLIVPQPLPIEEYERDFSSPEVQRRFRKLVDKSVQIELANTVSEENSNLSGEVLRTKNYALAGSYLVQHSSILIALWDGMPSSHRGGTADIVNYRIDGIPSNLEEDWNPMQFRENGLVYIIKTSRLSHNKPLRDSFAVFTRSASERMSSETSAELKRIDDFNRECNSATECAAGSNLLPDQNTFRTFAADDTTLQQLELLGRRFTAADSLAIGAQQTSRRYLLTILLAAFVATLSVNQLNKFQLLTLFVLSALAIGTAYGVHFFGIRRGRTQTKHQDYRALAEALRVQLFWTIAGMRDRAQRYFLQNSTDDSSWVRTAVRYSSAALPLSRCPPNREALSFVMGNWIVNQRQYFEGAFKKQLAKNMALSSLKFSLLLVAGLFKLLPNTIKWIDDAHNARNVWFIIAQASVAIALIAYHVWSRGRELRALKISFAQLGVPSTSTQADVGLWSRPSGLLTMVSIAFGAASLVAFAAVSRDLAESELILQFSELIFITSASAAAMIHMYGHVNAFADHLRQYSRMFSLYSHAEKILKPEIASGNFSGAQKILLSLGREALAEAGDWLRLHRARPIEVPKV